MSERPGHTISWLDGWLAAIDEPCTLGQTMAGQGWRASLLFLPLLLFFLLDFSLSLWRWSDRDALSRALDTFASAQVSGQQLQGENAREAVLRAFEQPGMILVIALASLRTNASALLLLVLATAAVMALPAGSPAAVVRFLMGASLATSILSLGVLSHTLLYFLQPTVLPPTSLAHLVDVRFCPSAFKGFLIHVDLFSVWYVIVLGLIAGRTFQVPLPVALTFALTVRLLLIAAATIWNFSAALTF